LSSSVTPKLTGQFDIPSSPDAFGIVRAAAHHRGSLANAQRKWFVTLFLLFVLGAGVQLHAQSAELDRKVFETTKAKAETGDAVSEFNLGVAYGDVVRVPRNYKEAARWYRKAAEQGMAAAQCKLGFLYSDGQGVQNDDTVAVGWFRKAAEQGNAVAQFYLGEMYADAHGVAQDYGEASKWLRKSAEQGNPQAQMGLGDCYDQGLGVAKDQAEALKWYRKAGEQNVAEAQYNVGNYYTLGLGVVKDYVEAVKWFRKAAAQGIAVAQSKLGTAYGSGEGVPKNYIEAYKWYSLAASQGNESAKTNLSIAEMRMTPEQVAEAQRLAREFTPRKTSDFNKDTTDSQPTASGTGFFITDDGYLISNYHVVKNAKKVRVLTSAGLISAKVVRMDAANDLALLKADGRSRAIRAARWWMSMAMLSAWCRPN
jgi:TPR repeat protein